MKVLHHGLFERKSVVHVILEQNRYQLELRDRCGTPTTFAGNQLVLTGLAVNGSDNDGLEHTELLDRRGQCLEAVVVKGLSRLKLIRPYGVDGDRCGWCPSTPY